MDCHPIRLPTSCRREVVVGVPDSIFWKKKTKHDLARQATPQSTTWRERLGSFRVARGDSCASPDAANDDNYEPSWSPRPPPPPLMPPPPSPTPPPPPSSPPLPPPGLHLLSTTDGRWPSSVIAAGAISISTIVIFPSTSTAAIVTICWQQLSKVSLRLLDRFEHARPCAPLMPSFDTCLGRFRLARAQSSSAPRPSSS